MALALLRNRDQLLGRHAHTHASVGAARVARGASCGGSGSGGSVFGFCFVLFWCSCTTRCKSCCKMVILEWKRIKQLDGVIRASISGVGNVAGSYLETILVAPAGAHAQLSVLHTRRPSLARPTPAVLQVDAGSRTVCFFFFLIGFETKHNGLLHHEACVASGAAQEPES